MFMFVEGNQINLTVIGGGWGCGLWIDRWGGDCGLIGEEGVVD